MPLRSMTCKALAWAKVTEGHCSIRSLQSKDIMLLTGLITSQAISFHHNPMNAFLSVTNYMCFRGVRPSALLNHWGDFNTRSKAVGKLLDDSLFKLSFPWSHVKCPWARHRHQTDSKLGCHLHQQYVWGIPCSMSGVYLVICVGYTM